VSASLLLVSTDSSEPVPSPALVAAWEALGMQRTEQVPMWAAHWLAQGLDGEGIVALACLDKAEARAIHDAVPAALRDAGVDPLTEVAAAARLCFDHIARMYLGGSGSWQWVISTVTGTFEQNNWAAELFDEPLGSLFGLDDELAGEWAVRRRLSKPMCVKRASARLKRQPDPY
jgi:hypothetical protein